MKERIKELRLSLGLSQESFGKKIGITRASVCQIENGVNSVANSTLKAIISVYGVREEWLVNGTGDMYPQLTKEELVAQIVSSALGSDCDDFVLNTFIALGQLSPKEWQIVKDFIEKIKG